MYQLRKYHGDRVQSLTYDDGKLAFSIGIIAPGEYEFGSIKKEIFTVTHGEISAWYEGGAWTIASQGKGFEVPGHKNFKLKVEQVSAYICYYE
ncbi:MAG: pyrimidine/purine nucleoside phosphorylase [Chlorobi bacterium]|nr:pyrimidine/purine nucleoside phosphorylase [Chlorobiota bacterium]